MSATYDHASKVEANDTHEQLERLRTAGDHEADRGQPSLPVVHRTFANPAPLGLLSFATGIFLISILGVHARGIQTPNVMVGVLMFFGGICQFISGILEFVTGNTFGATVFPAYAAFNFSYAMIYIPGTGILAGIIFTIAAMRSSWVLWLTLFFLDIELLLLAIGYLMNSQATLAAANSLGFVVAFCSYWAGSAGLWAGDLNPINLPTFSMYKED